MRRTPATLAMLAVAMLVAPALGAPGFLKTITIDGDYSDWADVPALGDDSGDNSGGPDIGVTKIANDETYLYIYNTFPNGVELSTFTTIDVDGNLATGFDVFGLGLIGSEVGWQNDFPFTQATGNFNNGVGMSGDFFGSGAALLDDFANGTQRELAIKLDIVINAGGGPVFPDNTIELLFWTDAGLGADGIPSGLPGDSGLNGDVAGPFNYELAVVPESSTLVALFAALGAFGLRRR